MTTGLHVSTIAVSEHASQNRVAFNAAMTMHDVSGVVSDTSAHAAVGVHDMVIGGLHGEPGTATFHDALTLSASTFAHQMHV